MLRAALLRRGESLDRASRDASIVDDGEMTSWALSRRMRDEDGDSDAWVM